MIIVYIIFAAEPNAAVAIIGNIGDAIVGNAVVTAKVVEAAAVLLTDTAITRAKP